MSAIGTKRTCRRGWLTSAFGGKADIRFATGLGAIGSARVEKEAEASVAKERAAASLTPLRLRPS